MIDIGVAVALIVGLTQLAKMYIPNHYIPLTSVVLGVVGGIFLFSDLDMTMRIVNGIALGLSSSGLFDMTKLITKRPNKY
jgi:hypothetical protein